MHLIDFVRRLGFFKKTKINWMQWSSFFSALLSSKMWHTCHIVTRGIRTSNLQNEEQRLTTRPQGIPTYTGLLGIWIRELFLAYTALDLLFPFSMPLLLIVCTTATWGLEMKGHGNRIFYNSKEHQNPCFTVFHYSSIEKWMTKKINKLCSIEWIRIYVMQKTRSL